MYDFANRRDRDEVAITRETRMAFADALALVSSVVLFAAFVAIGFWWFA